MNFRLVIIILAILGCDVMGQINRWEQIGQMPFPVHGGEAVSCDSVIYILGGFSDSLNSPTDLIQAYYPERNEWKTAGKMKEARAGFVALRYKDEIILYGGLQEGDTVSHVLERVKILPDTITFSSDTTLKENRIYATGVIQGNSLIIIGGNFDLTGNKMTDTSSYIFIYNLESRTSPLKINSSFSSPNNIPVQQMSAVYGDVVYVFGGLYLGISSWIYEFNSKDNILGRKFIDLQEPRAGGRAVSDDMGAIYLIGGYNETTTSLKSTEVFEIWKQNLHSGSPLNDPRKEFMAVNFNQNIYVFGGKGIDDKTISSIEKLSLLPVTTNSEKSITLRKFNLNSCYPNPFNPTTNMTFSVPDSRNIRLIVYSALGEKIRTVTSGYYLPGTYKVAWDGKDDHGNNASSGIYFFTLTDGINSFTKKAVLLK